MKCWEKHKREKEKPNFKNALTYPEAIIFPEKPKMKTYGTYPNSQPQGAVIHHTSGWHNASGDATVQYAIDKKFCYFVITEDGKVYQQFDLNRYGSHAGKSKDPITEKSRVSKELVGIELCGAGKLERRPDGFYSWFNHRYSNVREIRNNTDNQMKGHYQKFPAVQERGLIDLLLWLEGNFEDFKFNRVWGHDEVAGPKGLGYWRKNDPGGSLSMTMTEFRDKLKGLKRYRQNNPNSKLY